MEPEQLFNGGCKLRRKKLVSFVHDECRTLIKFHDLLSREICYPARSANNDVNRLVQTNDIIFETSATGRDHDIDPKVLP